MLTLLLMTHGSHLTRSELSQCRKLIEFLRSHFCVVRVFVGGEFQQEYHFRKSTFPLRKSLRSSKPTPSSHPLSPSATPTFKKQTMGGSIAPYAALLKPQQGSKTRECPYDRKFIIFPRFF